MFNFLLDAGNYESRKVARYDSDGLMVSTARVSDGAQPFETAVRHPSYNEGKVVIVEAYDDHASAQAGHNRWVALMTSEALPDKLVDCCNSEIGSLAGAMGCETEFPRKD